MSSSISLPVRVRTLWGTSVSEVDSGLDGVEETAQRAGVLDLHDYGLEVWP